MSEVKVDQSSPFLEKQSDNTSNQDSTESDNKRSVYTYILAGIVISLVLYIFYYSYGCFQSNQDLAINEGFIEKTIKSGPDSDKSFDMDSEIKRLSDMQEQFLRKLNLR